MTVPRQNSLHRSVLVIQNFITHDDRSAELNYYLAMCLWKGNQTESKSDLTKEIESHLKRALALIRIIPMLISSSGTYMRNSTNITRPLSTMSEL